MRRDDGLTYVEVITTLVMVSVAVVATTYSLYFGNRSLDLEMHKQQVLRIVQQEVEFWVGRMYTGQPGVDPSAAEMMGSVNNPYRTVLLDPDSKEPIQVKLFYDPITAVANPNTQSGIGYWIITIWAEWTEPDGQQFKKSEDTAVILTTYVSHV